MAGTVKFRYGSWNNITFHGVLDSGVEREDWEEMTMVEQNEVMSELLFGLVDMDELPDEDDDSPEWTL
jgi:hypothetical protein